MNRVNVDVENEKEVAASAGNRRKKKLISRNKTCINRKMRQNLSDFLLGYPREI
jgi:hypothetical protein